ncbi:hypothetical protein LJB90_00955 [Eubacteriales bacterium OttesenSCG-928-G02]|nr:hypothetical protein [Eubacteriales bacterium OttesenSCG-928-G02]
METNKIFIPNEKSYKHGAVTYKVTAFFDAEKPQLQDKLKHLLSTEIKNNSICTFAKSHEGDVK